MQFVIPVSSYRHLKTTSDKSTSESAHKDYSVNMKVVDLMSSVDLTDWRRLNVRDPKLSGSVPRAISDGAKDEVDLFVYMNRGIVIAVENISYDNNSDLVTFNLVNTDIHGLLDGGHTYSVLRNLCLSGDMPQDTQIKVEFLMGFNKEEIIKIVDARNTSNQVRDQSLLNLEGKFDGIKAALVESNATCNDDIAWSEYEIYRKGESGKVGYPKPISIREVISLLVMFDIDNFNGEEDDKGRSSPEPVIGYTGKQPCLDYFKTHFTSVEKAFSLTWDIMKLHDAIRKVIGDKYNKNGGKFGRNRTISIDKDNGYFMHFTKETSIYDSPNGYIYPLLASFRIFLEEKNGKYVWVGGRTIDDIIALLDGQLGLKLAKVLNENMDKWERNSTKMGCDRSFWGTVYTIVENFMVKSKDFQPRTPQMS